MTQTASTEFPALDSDPIEKLAIDTIRTLCIDAVQAANSGHPGTPMALAPVMYSVWQKTALRPRPSDLEQSRSVRAVRWACLDFALLDASSGRRQVGQSPVRGPRRASRSAGGPEEVPPARFQVPWPSGVPLDCRHRMHHRSARHGHRDQRWNGDGRPVAGGHVQPTRLRLVQLQRLRDCW